MVRATAAEYAGPVWLIPAFPLLGAAILLLTGPRWRGRSAGWLGVATVTASFVATLWTLVAFLAYRFDPAGAVGVERPALISHVYEWVVVGEFRVDVAFRIDQLSLIMALVVTGVGALIHLYSIDYMAGAPRFPRFFAYMNLFVFFMLLLVLANNFLVLYVGWEGVGLCSYLLIGFWSDRPAAATAAKKAFVTTRIGDSAFLLGIFLVWVHFHSLDFGAFLHGAGRLAPGTATVISLLFLAGAVGKSAQLPLHVWLPDAMEGPTPVSALIHAATMVTAGVYLVVRAHSLFEASTVAPTVVAVIGIATAIYAGLSAMAQDDIKRMLAYSTISQLGFMFFGAGVGAYAAAIFLLVVHAFFKALLFLGAGSVMHGLHDQTDMMWMGGLRKEMKWTAVTWLVGAAAMAGLWPLSGGFAKDQVIAAASHSGRVGLWVAALIGALLTAIYISRATFMTFFGDARFERRPHDPPTYMRIVLVALAFAALLGGVLGVSATNGVIPRFLAPVVGETREAAGGPPEAVLTLISVAIALVGIGIAYVVYLSGRVDWYALRMRFARQKRTMQRGFYVDDFYARGIVRLATAGARFLSTGFDQGVIDAAVDGVGRIFGGLAAAGRRVQTGLVRNYAVGILLGVVGVLLYLAVRF